MVNHKLTLNIDNNHYPVIIGSGLIASIDFLQSHCQYQRAIVVTDACLAPLYSTVFQRLDAIDIVTVANGEEAKSLTVAHQLYEFLHAGQYDKNTLLIALGGGAIGDLAGFVAATWMRGMRFIQIPTTLLAQIDAAIGGKNALNFGGIKNRLGTFYQPECVLIDVATIKTLPTRVYKAAFGEILKYALIEGEPLLSLLEDLVQNGISRCIASPESLIPVMLACCQCKIRLVTADVLDRGVRVLLNLGHTFGHAFEGMPEYDYLHGEAVGLGIYCAALVSWKKGTLDWSYVLRIQQLLRNMGLPAALPQTLDLQAVLHNMYCDKKNLNRNLRLILLEKPGKCYIDECTEERIIIEALAMACQGEKG